MKPRFNDLRRYCRNIEITGEDYRAKFDTSLPFELGTLNEFCWLWNGAKFRYKGLEVNAAKFAYQWLVAELTENHTIQSTCLTANCVNPFHAQAVITEPPTKRATCRKAHLYNLETIYAYPDGRYECKLCRRSRWARYRRSHIKNAEK